jgi:hypothetical protein
MRRDVVANHILKKMIVTMRSQGLFNIKNMQNPNFGRGKAIRFVDPILGSFVYQLLEGIALALARWKGIVKKKYFLGQIKSFGYH